MNQGLFDHVLLPIANEDDAAATCRAARPYLESGDGRVVAVHVVEKAGGAPDKASVEQRQLEAEAAFEVVHERLDGFDVETRVVYGTNVAETILEVAKEIDATAIVFTPRSGGRWIRLLTGDVAASLISDSDRPVIVLPDVEEE